MPASRSLNCPHCGGELLKSATPDHDPDAEVKPTGGILVCGDCFMAVDPSGLEEIAPEPGVRTDVDAS